MKINHKTLLPLLMVCLLLFACGDKGAGTSDLSESDGSTGSIDEAVDTADLDESDGSTESTDDSSSGSAFGIDFVSATPEMIALKNTGGPARSETAILVFKVVDDGSDPLAGQTVNFELSTTIGGLSLSNASDISDAAGLVQTTVRAGTVSTHIRVHATLAESNPLITVVSDELVVSTGLPDQNSISIAAEMFNPEGLQYNNEEVIITFQAADYFNNFVPDGSMVYFTTELGSIDETCELEDGVCEVIWRSGNPRTSYCDDLNPPCSPYWSTVTAFLVGEESFTDVNGNGYYDPEDIFDESGDQAEPYRDDNENGQRDFWEPWWDYDANGVHDSEPNGIYNGSLCSTEAQDQGLCTTELVYVQDGYLIIVLSGSFADITFTPTVVNLVGPDDAQTVSILIADQNGNPMPADSEVKFSITNGEFLGDDTFKVPSTIFATTHQVVIVPSPDDGTTGFLTVKVTTPNGNISSNLIQVNDDS
jgi:hypothetical protein